MVRHEACVSATAERRHVIGIDIRQDGLVARIARPKKQLIHAVRHRAELAVIRESVCTLDESLSFSEVREESARGSLQGVLLVASNEPLRVDGGAGLRHGDEQRSDPCSTKLFALDQLERVPAGDAPQLACKASECGRFPWLHVDRDTRGARWPWERFEGGAEAE
jgi:hypothetical protein